MLFLPSNESLTSSAISEHSNEHWMHTCSSSALLPWNIAIRFKISLLCRCSWKWRGYDTCLSSVLCNLKYPITSSLSACSASAKQLQNVKGCYYVLLLCSFASYISVRTFYLWILNKLKLAEMAGMFGFCSGISKDVREYVILCSSALPPLSGRETLIYLAASNCPKPSI